ncbi:MAG: EMC3/TMCO1 family protein [archaeon]
MVFFSPMIELAIISVAMVVVQKVLQLKIGNQKQLKEHQDKMKKTQEKVKELMKRDDEKSRKERENMEKEMLDSMNIVMGSSMKFMVVSLVVVLPVFWLVGSVYAQDVIDLPAPVPWIAPNVDIVNPLTWIHFYSQTNWIGWYVLTSLLFSLLVLNPLTKIIENRKK